MTTILHVEDDPALAELVSDAFEAFGFRGPTITATTVAHARRILSDPEAYGTIDLVVSDMQLPDGSGLDVVQAVRTHPMHAHVPILILSSQLDPERVNRAYALGANAYISKGMRGRSVTEMLRALHDHWLKDAQLPTPRRAPRTQETVARGAKIQARKAKLFMKVAEQLGADHPRSELWMDLALGQGNLASLLSFLLGQLGDRELSDDTLTDVYAMQMRQIELSDELERRPVRTTEEADRCLQRIVASACTDARVIVRAAGQLFPVVPVAITALRDVAATALEDMATWIESYCNDAPLRDHVGPLRDGAAHLRAGQPGEPTRAGSPRGV